MHASAGQVTSSAVEILRTPMPFGSPVPDPRHTTTFAQTLGEAAGQKRPAVNQPAYNKLPCNVPFELRCSSDSWQQLFTALAKIVLVQSNVLQMRSCKPKDTSLLHAQQMH